MPYRAGRAVQEFRVRVRRGGGSEHVTVRRQPQLGHPALRVGALGEDASYPVQELVHKRGLVLIGMLHTSSIGPGGRQQKWQFRQSTLRSCHFCDMMK